MKKQAISVLILWLAFTSLVLAGEPMASLVMSNDEAAFLAINAESFAQNSRRLFGDPKIIERRNAPSLLGTNFKKNPSDGEMSDEVKISPSDNDKREKIIRKLFFQAGAQPHQIYDQDIGQGRRNIIVFKKGSTDRAIIIGGHHDKVRAGQGTIDNWTGATMVANLYQVFRDVETKHTLVFITFGREEEGLVGSEYLVKNLSKERLAKIDAMINLDALAVDGTFSWKNNSDESLLKAFRDTARKTSLDLAEKNLSGWNADSSSFRRAGVQAMTLFGTSPEVIFDIIHSEKDNFGAFNLLHYKNSFLLTKAVIEALDSGAGSSSSNNATTKRRKPHLSGEACFSLPKGAPWSLRIFESSPIKILLLKP